MLFTINAVSKKPQSTKMSIIIRKVMLHNPSEVWSKSLELCVGRMTSAQSLGPAVL